MQTFTTIDRLRHSSTFVDVHVAFAFYFSSVYFSSLSFSRFVFIYNERHSYCTIYVHATWFLYLFLLRNINTIYLFFCYVLFSLSFSAKSHKSFVLLKSLIKRQKEVKLKMVILWFALISFISHNKRIKRLPRAKPFRWLQLKKRLYSLVGAYIAFRSGIQVSKSKSKR